MKSAGLMQQIDWGENQNPHVDLPAILMVALFR